MRLLACACGVAGLALVLAGSAHAQSLPTDESAFQIGKRWPLIGYPTALTAADLDDDGLPDLIVAESMPNRIAIWWNDGYGGLEPTPTVIADLPALAAVAVDANGDGTPDVVWSDSLGLHRALVGPGRQVGPAELIVGGPDLGPLAVGDLDGDGHDDLVFGHGSTVSWMRSASAGLMAPAVLESTGTTVTVLAIGQSGLRGGANAPVPRRGQDDRSDEVDIAVAYEWSYDEPPPDIDVLHIGRGVVTGTIEVPLPQDFGPVWSAQLADLDADGALDLVVGGWNGAVALWGNGFTQSWAFGVGPGLWPTDSYNLAVADLDGDGRLDVVTEAQYGHLLFGDGALCVFSGIGSRSFNSSGTRYIPDPDIRGGEYATEYQGLVLTDMNGDGQPDIVMVETRDSYPSGRGILVALSSPEHEVGLERIDRLSDGSYPSYPDLHVIQPPGLRPDELMVIGESGTESVRFGDGSRLIAEPGPELHGPLLFADVDGDGREDAIEVRDSSCVVHLDWKARADAAPETVAVPGLRCAAHLEGDRSEALVGADTEGNLVIAQRRRDGGYDYEELPSYFQAPSYGSWFLHYVGAAAVPRGGRLQDRLVICGPTLDLRHTDLVLLERSPSGSWDVIQRFSSPATRDPIWAAPHPLVVSDMNADGNPDVLLMESEGGEPGLVHVFLGDHDGTLGPPLPQTVGLTEYPVAFEVADVDGDGRPDVVIPAARESNTPWLAVYFGDGRGQFDRWAFLYLGTLFTGGASAAVADLDGDGIPDIAALSSTFDGTFLTTIFGADRKPAPPRRHPSRVGPIAGTDTPLAIATISPMPARDAFDVRFTAPSPEPSRLELLDVTGRRVTERTVGGTGPARFNIGNDVRSGVYWLRLTQGAHSATARVVVLK